MPAHKGADKRKGGRVSAILVTDLKSSKGAKGRGCLTDLSLGGLGFESEADFEKGSEVSLTFHMPVEVHGRIVHADKKGALKKYGVQFTNMGKGDKLRLEQFVTVRVKK
jgi:c-di-GMP-binding flagellar brake protein YcgR